MMPTSVKVARLGSEGQPVVVIDDFSSQADDLLTAARSADYCPAGQHYPGDRAPAPADYLAPRSGLLGQLLTDVFGFRKGADLVSSDFSIVTTRPKDLTIIQRIPHFDGTSPKILALLHYLCPAEAGGTSFYRHCATGFETINDERAETYDSALRAEIGQGDLLTPAYFSGEGEQFERIGQVPARFNRMVIYRGCLLHSGDILQPERIGQGPETGRITLNTFLHAR